MVLKVKPDGNDPPGISKFKGGYCGKGFYQKKGNHYLNTHAFVASAVTTRLLVPCHNDNRIQLATAYTAWVDVSNAYLNSPLDPRVVLFVKPPLLSTSPPDTACVC